MSSLQPFRLGRQAASASSLHLPPDPSASVAVKLEYALKKVSKQAAQYEGQMKDLESKLSENLSNFRAIDSLLSEAFSGLQRNTKRADRAVHHQVPGIHRDLQDSREVLEDLAETLPTVQAQVQDIFDVYESGRQKVRASALLTAAPHLTFENLPGKELG
ncbi:hypothetical protein EST38_g1981 [Candolleomyces aberdarensis]|uniref:Uncharacterized protein n=1 Tax=Candolleomyces aberdarensis TaxID=2316362 RepID=A0A4Q2DUG0_9AGAR|nr:hypothetical protein EST38_g1981 [Candolleomyces aberdarensis]